MIEDDSHQRAAEGVADQDRRLVEPADDALEVSDRVRHGHHLDRRAILA
jgi:hypothetical protein